MLESISLFHVLSHFESYDSNITAHNNPGVTYSFNLKFKIGLQPHKKSSLLNTVQPSALYAIQKSNDVSIFLFFGKREKNNSTT